MIRSRNATCRSVLVPLLLFLLGGRTALLPQYRRHNVLAVYVAEAFCLTLPRTYMRTKASAGGGLCMSKKTQPPRYQKPYQWRRRREKDRYDDEEEERNDIFDQGGNESYGRSSSSSSRHPRRRRSLSTVGKNKGGVTDRSRNKPQQRGVVGRGSNKPYAKKRRGNRTSPRVGATTSSFNSTDGGGGSIEEKEEEEEETPIQTLGGGSSLIFAMARRMLVWQNDNLAFNDSSAANDNRNNNASPSSSTTPTLTTTGRSSSPLPPVLPRWHPHGGISDVNPSFRNKPPVMNNAGYAGVIRRNSRKRNKPSMWRHSLRMYEKMKSLELKKKKEDGKDDDDDGVKSAGAAAASGGRRLLSIQRGTIHHEGALVSCAKLGLWEEALRIYNEVEKEEGNNKKKKDVGGGKIMMNRPASSGLVNVKNVGGVTDNMVLSVVSACVRGSKKKTKSGREKKRGGGGNDDECEGGDDGCVPVEERRVPLDRAREILLSLEEKHNIPLVSHHINPLAAAYQSLGLNSDASYLLQNCLIDHTTITPDDDYENSNNSDDENDTTTTIQTPTFNVNDLRAKDRASYSLLVKGAVGNGDWVKAVEALEIMTERGLYPNGRDLNSWTEVGQKKDYYGVGGGLVGQGGRSGRRRRKSWKKKRDEFWLEGIP